MKYFIAMAALLLLITNLLSQDTEKPITDLSGNNLVKYLEKEIICEGNLSLMKDIQLYDCNDNPISVGQNNEIKIPQIDNEGKMAVIKGTLGKIEEKRDNPKMKVQTWSHYYLYNVTIISCKDTEETINRKKINALTKNYKISHVEFDGKNLSDVIESINKLHEETGVVLKLNKSKGQMPEITYIADDIYLGDFIFVIYRATKFKFYIDGSSIVISDMPMQSEGVSPSAKPQPSKTVKSDDKTAPAPRDGK